MTLTTRALTAAVLIGTTIALAAYGPEITVRIIIAALFARQSQL